MAEENGELEGPLDVYRPAERRIYRFFDGASEVTADPLDLYQRLMQVWPELSSAMKVARSASKDAEKNRPVVMEKIRFVFGVEALKRDGTGGLNEEETAGLLHHFMRYVESLKKNTSPSPT